MGKVPLKYYQETPKGRIRAEPSKITRLLTVRPNTIMTPTTLWTTTEMNCQHYGNGYIWMRGSSSSAFTLSEEGSLVSPAFLISLAPLCFTMMYWWFIKPMRCMKSLPSFAQSMPILQNVFPLVEMPRLSEIPLDGKEVGDEEYKAELKELQAKLGSLHNRLYRKRVPVIITYEGWDAAGKGGNIKRITEALDPRGFEVHPIASPEPHEKARHYLWRFWTRLPKDGHIAIFDRTWYGRVMVERLEGFCSENDWRRAYNEINEFEKELSDWGAVIVKFWVHIDKDTQLARFNDRQSNPEKQWKITDEDWRNREKWDEYETAADEMLQKTSTAYAPWHILESVDKKYARLKALRIVIEEIEKALK